MYSDAGDPPTLQADERTDRQTDDMQSQDCALHYSTSRGKQRRNTGIADVIGIADIVLLSILSIDPALDDNIHLRTT